MKENLKNFIRTNTPRRVVEFLTYTPDVLYRNHSYSQEGEDRILSRLFEKKNEGVYVDVGAHHPFRFSNTYLFYLRGWRGINIDILPGTAELFDEYRPLDTNLEMAISKEEKVLKYYMYEHPAYNTFSEEIVKNLQQEQNLSYVDCKEFKTTTLEQGLDKFLQFPYYIDFLNVDVEGLDLEVLKSNNWSKYRPRIVLVESLSANFICNEDLQKDKVFAYMESQSYKLIAKTYNTLFFEDTALIKLLF